MSEQGPEWLLDASDCPGYRQHEIVAHVSRGSTIHHTEYHFVTIPKRYALVNIHDYVEDAVTRSGVLDGFCFVSAMHITAGIYVNDAEDGLLEDLSGWLEDLAPFGKNYHHHHTGEDNGDAHLKSYLTNHAVTAPITNKKLDFGTWQRIFYAEFDGLRQKRILVKISGIA